MPLQTPADVLMWLPDELGDAGPVWSSVRDASFAPNRRSITTSGFIDTPFRAYTPTTHACRTSAHFLHDRAVHRMPARPPWQKNVNFR
jgi:hypothetical protein